MSAEAKQDDGELFAHEMEQRYGPPEPGDYVIELIANRGIKLTSSSSSGARFLWFTVRFLEGPRRGRELRLSIVVDGPPSMAPLVRRGLQVLEDWRQRNQDAGGDELCLAIERHRPQRPPSEGRRHLRPRQCSRRHRHPDASQDQDRGSAALMSYEFTRCQSAEAACTAAKTITRRSDGSIDKRDYDNTTFWYLQPLFRATHADMATKLRRLAGRPWDMIVMGAPVPVSI